MIDLQDTHRFALEQMYRLHHAVLRVVPYDDAQRLIQNSMPLEDVSLMVSFLLQDHFDSECLKTALAGEVGLTVAMYEGVLHLEADASKDQLMRLCYSHHIKRVLDDAQEKVEWLKEAYETQISAPLDSKPNDSKPKIKS